MSCFAFVAAPCYVVCFQVFACVHRCVCECEFVYSKVRIGGTILLVCVL